MLGGDLFLKHETSHPNFYKSVLNTLYIHFLQITSSFSWRIPGMQCNFPQFNLLVPRPTAVLLKFVWSSGMNPWDTMASIEILDMRKLLVLYSQHSFTC